MTLAPWPGHSVLVRWLTSFSLGVAIQAVAALTVASGMVAAVTRGRRSVAVPIPQVEVST